MYVLSPTCVRHKFVELSILAKELDTLAITLPYHTSRCYCEIVSGEQLLVLL